MNFPLFEDIYMKCSRDPTKYKFTDITAMTISTMPPEKDKIINNIYYMIHHYYVLEQNAITNNWQQAVDNAAPIVKDKLCMIEYGGITFKGNNGIKFEISKLPEALKIMIAAYIDMLSDDE